MVGDLNNKVLNALTWLRTIENNSLGTWATVDFMGWECFR